jgi:hypothetical protein
VDYTKRGCSFLFLKRGSQRAGGAVVTPRVVTPSIIEHISRFKNATPSITLHSVSKVRLDPGIREYSGPYSEAYSWK